MTGSPPLSVVIPTHQRRERLRRALTALGQQTVPSDSYEVVVAVDGSSDGTAEMLRTFTPPFDLAVVEGPKRSRAAARNAALEIARGEVIVILDDDMEAAPELIERHRRHHPPGSRDCVLGAVPIKLGADDPPTARYVAARFDAHLANLARPGHVFTTRDFYSGNVSLRAEVLRAVGGFDPTFAVYGNEDVELSLRLREAGVAIGYDAAALAHQAYDKDLRDLARDTFEKGRSTVMLARAHPAAFGSLRLTEPGEGSRPWLALRAGLLRLPQSRPGARDSIAAAAVHLERIGLWRQPLFYRAMLDYAFWAGVEVALDETDDGGELARLAAELRRGPLDLLLHR